VKENPSTGFKENTSTCFMKTQKPIDMFLMNTQQLAGYFPESGSCLFWQSTIEAISESSTTQQAGVDFLLCWSSIPPLVSNRRLLAASPALAGGVTEKLETLKLEICDD